jgi:hypothetical protein
MIEGVVRTITPERGAELKRLYVDLAAAYSRAADALRLTGRPLGSAALERLMEEDDKARAIVRRIKRIQGK